MTTPQHGDLPVVRQVAIDCPDPRRLAEFYRELAGYTYRPGDEPPADGRPDASGADWLVLRAPDGTGGCQLAFQQTDDYVPPEWSAESPLPAGAQRQMLHLDLTVPDVEALTRHRDRAIALGARVLLDRSEDQDEPLYVFADPVGHPFCIFVG